MIYWNSGEMKKCRGKYFLYLQKLPSNMAFSIIFVLMAIKNFAWFLVSRNISPVTDQEILPYRQAESKKVYCVSIESSDIFILAVGTAVFLLFWSTIKWPVINTPVYRFLWQKDSYLPGCWLAIIGDV